MAQNVLPANLGALAVLAGKCEAGLNTYAAALGITQITPASLSADAAALTDAMGAFNAARAGRTAASGVLNAASAVAKKFLSDARGILVAHWGQDYSQQWAAAGWTDNSTAVPDTLPGRLSLVQALAGFLTANPTYAVNAPPLVFTAANAQAVADALQSALDGVGAADDASGAAKATRTAADDVLRKDIRALISILNLKLTPNDARWAAFGLNAPGAAVTPSAPTGLQSYLALAGQIHATCSTPPGTDHFRWYLQAPGQPAFVNVTDTAEAELLLSGQPNGQTVQLRVSAVNAAGESVQSGTISVAVM